VINCFANAGIHKAADLASSRSAEWLTRWPSGDKVNRDVLEQSDKRVPGALVAKVKVKSETREVVTMSLQRPSIVINGRCNRPPRSFDASTQTTGAAEQVNGDRPSCLTFRSTPSPEGVECRSF